MKSIKFTHWQDGGTGITNFKREQEKLYAEAIRRHGNNELVIAHHPINCDGFICDGLFSLHDLRENNKDLSDFWKEFKKVKEDHPDFLTYEFFLDGKPVATLKTLESMGGDSNMMIFLALGAAHGACYSRFSWKQVN